MAYVSPYTTKEIVRSAAGGERRLVQLTDAEGTGNFNQDELEQAQAEADGWIDSYLQRRLRTPITPPPQLIVTMAAQETVYRLEVRRNRVPAESAQRHEERRLWLVDASKGLVNLGVEPERASSSAITPEIIERSPLETVTRAALKGFA